MNNPIRTALIGYGKAAHMHAQALKNIPENILVAVQGRDISKARIFGDQYNIAPYSDLEKMISKERLDMIVICTPHPLSSRFRSYCIVSRCSCFNRKTYCLQVLRMQML